MHSKSLYITTLLFISACVPNEKNSQGEAFNSQVDKVSKSIQFDGEQLTFFDQVPQPIEPKFANFKQSSITPRGWLKEMMENDLQNGIVGALDELYPGIRSDDIFHENRRGGMDDVPEMGDLVLTGAPWEKSIMWWNSETIGNWWDGFIRHAYMINDSASILQSERIINNLLESQDESGYIGIYKPNLRYNHTGSNGELWAQTTAFRAMLAYYEFTGDNKVLSAVEEAMAITMNKYGPQGKNPFDLENAFGGVTHGLMMSDVCETLYKITNKAEYQEYATYLYRAFSSYSINRSFNDLRYPFLLKKDTLFEGHAVHTYEHIRTLVNAYYNTGYKELESAKENMLHKLNQCLLPSGAGHGNEWIAKLEANPSFTSTEYCAMLELRNSYQSLFQKTGDISFADQSEKITYNAMLGFRNQDGTAITYGKPDNCYILDGHHHEHDESRPDPRYKYSPTHSEPAVCCVPNYARNLPYFLSQMFLKTDKAIVLAQYGPCILKTKDKDTDIEIEQKTNYPWEEHVTIIVDVTQPTSFELLLRKPKWSENIKITGTSNNISIDENFYAISGPWEGSTEIKLEFDNPTTIQKIKNDEGYVQKGPLVYAFPISHKEEVIKQYDDPKFRDYYCRPLSKEYENISLIGTNESENSLNEPSILCDIYNSSSDSATVHKFIPMGKTTLRRVSFPLRNELD